MRSKSYRIPGRIRRQDLYVDENGEKWVAHSSEGYTEVPDDADDGHFPHLLHLIHGLRQVRGKTRQRLRAQGLKIREGSFSKREKDQLHLNFERIMLSEHISGFWSDEDQYLEVGCTILRLFDRIKKPMGITLEDITEPSDSDDPLLTARLELMYELGRGLPFRTLDSIKQQAGMMCVKLRPQSYCTDKEKRKICKLKRRGWRRTELGWKYKLHPQSIGEIIIEQLTPDLQWVSKEPFTFKEDRKLVRLVKKRLGIQWMSECGPGSFNNRRKDWSSIAIRIRGRSIRQCINRFRLMRSLRDTQHMQLLERSKSQYSIECAKVIRFLQSECDEGVTCEAGIDWSALRVRMRDKTMPELTYMYDELIRQIPEAIGTDLEDRVDWLRKHRLPKLTRRAKTSAEELDKWITTRLTLTGTIANDD